MFLICRKWPSLNYAKLNFCLFFSWLQSQGQKSTQNWMFRFFFRFSVSWICLFFEIVFFVFASKTFLSGNLLGQKSRVSGIVITYLCKEVYPQHASLTQGINPSTKYPVEFTYNNWKCPIQLIKYKSFMVSAVSSV